MYSYCVFLKKKNCGAEHNLMSFFVSGGYTYLQFCLHRILTHFDRCAKVLGGRTFHEGGLHVSSHNALGRCEKAPKSFSEGLKKILREPSHNA